MESVPTACRVVLKLCAASQLTKRAESKPGWSMAWPGHQDGLGQGTRLKWAKGRSGSKNGKKVKVLRMEFSVVENLSGLQESIFNLSRGSQLHFGGKSNN